MMKKIFLIICTLINLAAIHSFCDDQKKGDPNQLFYNANSLYERRDYEKAAAEYLKILDFGVESPGLYYNIGNSYFKLGRLGRAILYYERAKRLSPQDADLKSNLAYARSFVGSSSSGAQDWGMIAKLVASARFEDFNLNAIAIAALVIYLVVIGLQVLFFFNSLVAKKVMALYIMVLAVFIVSVSAFGLRFYNEEVLRHGVVVEKEVDCKYEPIDKAMTYYKLQEGDEVIILNTRSGWSQIKRPDGKIGWVVADSAEEI
ncbi:MAG: tetratricopeptide repeat protein [Candidatus Omnitrophica bacterium]|nr:tetratricopeptide repeat protein [Candidatus Omnitrophota bacterium]